MLGSSRNWQSAGADLAAHFHVYAPDMRNHGRSPHAGSISYAEMMADVLAWQDREEIGPATFVGHSMGGKVAMLLACRRPARVARLVVVDVAPKDYYWPGHRASFAAMNELNLALLRSRSEAESHFSSRVPNWALRKFLVTNLDRDPGGAWFWQINLPVLTAALPELERNPLSAEDRYEGPALFLAGGQSNYVEEDDHDAIRRHFPAAEIRVLPESGHSPHMEARADFVAAVVAGAA